MGDIPANVGIPGRDAGVVTVAGVFIVRLVSLGLVEFQRG